VLAEELEKTKESVQKGKALAGSMDELQAEKASLLTQCEELHRTSQAKAAEEQNLLQQLRDLGEHHNTLQEQFSTLQHRFDSLSEENKSLLQKVTSVELQCQALVSEKDRYVQELGAKKSETDSLFEQFQSLEHQLEERTKECVHMQQTLQAAQNDVMEKTFLALERESQLEILMEEFEAVQDQYHASDSKNKYLSKLYKKALVEEDLKSEQTQALLSESVRSLDMVVNGMRKVICIMNSTGENLGDSATQVPEDMPSAQLEQLLKDNNLKASLEMLQSEQTEKMKELSECVLRVVQDKLFLEREQEKLLKIVEDTVEAKDTTDRQMQITQTLCENLQEEISDLTGELEEVKALVADKESHLERVNTVKQGFEVEIQQFQSNLTSMQEEQQQLRTENEQLITRLTDFQASLELERDFHLTQIKNLQEEVTDLQEKAEKASSVRIQLLQDKAILEQQLRELQHVLENEREENALRSESLNKEVKEMQKCYDEREASFVQTDEELCDFRTQWGAVQEELVICYERQASLEAAHHKATHNMRNILRKMENLAGNLTAKQSEVAELSTVLQQKDALLVELGQKVRELELVLEQKIEEAASKDDQLQSMFQKLTRAQEDSAQLSISASEKTDELQDMKDRLEEALQGVHDLCREKDELEDRLMDAQAHLQRIELCSHEQEDFVQNLETELQGWKKKYEDTREALTSAESHLENAQADMKDLDIQVTSLEAELCKSQADLAKQKKELEQTRASSNRTLSLEEDLESLRTELLDARKHIDTLAEEVKELQCKLASSEGQISNLECKLESKESSLEEMTSQAMSLSKTKTELESCLQSAHEKVAALKIELEPLEIWHLAELEKHSFIETPNEKDGVSSTQTTAVKTPVKLTNQPQEWNHKNL